MVRFKSGGVHAPPSSVHAPPSPAPSTSRGRTGGRGGSSRTAPGVTLSPSQNLAISEGRDPNLTPSQRLAAEQGRITTRGGRSGSKSYSQRILAQEKERAVASARAVELKRIETAKSFAEKTRIAKDIIMSRRATEEMRRIELERQRILLAGGRVREQKLKDSKTGATIIHTTTIGKGGTRIFETKNLRTGDVTIRTYKKISGRVRQTGGLNIGGGVAEKIQDATNVRIVPSSDPNRLIVTLPNNVKGTIRSTGRVIIGRKLGGGNKYTFEDGVLRQINDVDIYEEKLGAISSEEFDTRTFSLQRAKNLSAELTRKSSNVKNRLQESIDAGELEKVRELQKLGRDRTAKQNTELRRLEKRTAENYRLGGELVGLFLANMFVRIGIGGTEFYKLLKENPRATLLALPSNLYDGVKADFKTFTSGDPLAISELGAEYYTGARIIRLAGKGFAVPVEIGKTLSPKYFSKIGTNILTPPATLRGLASKTVTGRRVAAIISSELKKKGVTAKVDAFIKKARKFKGSGDVKIKKAKKVTVSIIKNLESRTNLNKQYNRARKNFKISMQKRADIKVGNNDYVKAVVFLEGLTNNIARLKSQKFIKNYKAKGGKIDKRREGEFIEAVQKDASNKLNSLSDFKELKNTARLTKSFQINLRRRGKIESAKIIFRKIKVKIGKLSLVKKMNSAIRKIAAKSRMVKRVVKKGVKKVKLVGKRGISNLESRTNLNKQYNRARKNIRKSLKGKARTITIGNDDYIKAVVFIEQFSNNVATITAKRFLMNFKAKGGKIGLGQKEQFIKAVQNNFRKTLDNTSSFKKLKEAAILKKPFQVRLARKNKLTSAKRLSRILVGKVKATRTVKGMTSIINKVARGVKVVKRKVSPARIREKIKRRVEVAKQRRFVKQTIRYQMEKARPIRKVSTDKLKRSQKVSDINNFIDNFFNELNKRQKTNLTPIKFSQMKNVLKKRMRNAINKGNLPEINNFRIAIGKMISEMNKKSSYPNIKVVEVIGKKRRIRTIKDFESPSPKGTFVEVRSGGQVLLQRVVAKTVQKPRQVVKQRLEIVSVQKKAISLKPLLDFGVKSISAVAIKNTLIGKQTFGIASNQGQLIKVLSGSAQDFKVLQSIGQGMNVNVASAVMSAVRSNTRVRSRLKTKQVLKKKKVPVTKLKKKKDETRKLSKKVMTYAVAVKISGKMVRLKVPPLTLRDGWDFTSYRLDHQLQRSGRLIPVGMNNVVAKLPKNIANYYGKHSKKFRRFRIKKGKILSLERGIIERKKYIGDTASELKKLMESRRKSIKRKSSKKRIAKRVTTRKKLTTLDKLKSRKRVLILKRKRMINKLR